MDYNYLEVDDFNFDFGLQEMENQENYFDCYSFVSWNFIWIFSIYGKIK